MAKIFRFSGYYVEQDNEENIETFISRVIELSDNWKGDVIQQLHVEESGEFELDGEDEPNCDLALLERHFEHTANTTEFDRPIPKRGEVYRHFKGEYVVVMGTTRHTETQEVSVIYRHDGILWSRPLTMFMSKVDKIKYPYVEQEYRFERMVKYE